MTVFQLIIAEKVPESSQAIPLIGTIVLMLNFVENKFSFSSPTTLHECDGAELYKWYEQMQAVHI